MAARFPSRLAIALALALSACATQAPEQRPAPGPAVASPAAPTNDTATKRCVPGEGRVVRLTANDSAKAAADTMNGGVLGGVLSDDPKGAGGPTHPAAAASGHDIYVQMDDGRKLIVNQRELGGIAMGSRVDIDASCRARAGH